MSTAAAGYIAVPHQSLRERRPSVEERAIPPHESPRLSSWSGRRSVSSASGYNLRRLLLCSVALACMVLAALQGARVVKRSRQRTSLWDPSYRPPVRQLLTEEHHDEYWMKNLMPDVQYVTSSGLNGMTNIFMSFMNTLYFGKLSRRVAILPAMMGTSHMEWNAWGRFSTYFDLPRYTNLTGQQVLEWQDVRRGNRTSPSIPHGGVHLGCWSLGESMGPGRGDGGVKPFHSVHDDYWPLPPHVKQLKGYTEWHYDLWTLLNFDQGWIEKQEWIDTLVGPDRAKVNQELQGLRRHMPNEGAVRPTHQLTCFDDMFYLQVFNVSVTSVRTLIPDVGDRRAWSFGYVPAWDEVGRYLHFTPFVDQLADEVLTTLFGSSTKPFVALHIRRGDFSKQPPLDNFAAALDIIYEGMEARWSPIASIRPRSLPVYVATDASAADTAFWTELADRGWQTYNYSLHGLNRRFDDPWLDSIVDSAVLSRSLGMVGTWYSTFSLFSALRARDWSGAEVIEASYEG